MAEANSFDALDEIELREFGYQRVMLQVLKIAVIVDQCWEFIEVALLHVLRHLGGGGNDVGLKILCGQIVVV